MLKTIAEVANEMGVTKGAIYQRLARRGLIPRKGGRLTKHQIRQLQAPIKRKPLPIPPKPGTLTVTLPDEMREQIERISRRWPWFKNVELEE